MSKSGFKKLILSRKLNHKIRFRVEILFSSTGWFFTSKANSDHKNWFESKTLSPNDFGSKVQPEYSLQSRNLIKKIDFGLKAQSKNAFHVKSLT